MRPIALLITLLLLSPASHAQSRASRHVNPVRKTLEVHASDPSLPIRRLILYSNGVGYFERRGTVTGHAEIGLTFKQSEVDDVLKSMVVLDLGHGRIGAIGYNSTSPLSARLAEIPFSIPAWAQNSPDSGLIGVLRQLQGARVVVASANRAATGAILTVDERTSQLDANKAPMTIHHLVLASDSGDLASFDLSEVRSIRLLDDGARQGITEFANASALARRRDARTIVVTSDGRGSREMAISYTVPTPIWKTTYRLVLDASGKPFFQGWAVVDNVSDEDWDDVLLTLVSGSPISFIQSVQQPLYRYRPIIPIPDDLKLTPQVYEAAFGVAGGAPGGVVGGVIGSVGSGTGGGIGVGSGGGVGGGSFSSGAAAAVPPSAGPVITLSDAISMEESGVKAAATGSELGDLFEYKIDHPVTVRRGRSALIPILQTRMEAERVSIYSVSAREDRPMSGLRLKNTSPLTLEGGSLTVIDDDAYAGEALMERLKPGEERFISYALDLGTLVAARSKGALEPVFLVRLMNGAFQAHYYEKETKTYTLTNQTEKSRVAYIEHPARDGWMLSDDTPKPAQRAATVYRFRIELGPRATVEFPVAERRALMNTYALPNLTTRDLELYISSRNIDESTRAALRRILDIKGQVALVDARLTSADQEMGEITNDQRRFRENIKALEKTADARELILRYLAKANEQETRIEQLTKNHRAAAGERDRLQVELNAALRGLERSP